MIPNYSSQTNIYSVGEPAVDMQHRRILQMMENLRSAVEAANGQDGDRQVVEEVLRGMLEYARGHFADEEVLLRAHLTPAALRVHQQQHDAFLRQAFALHIDLHAGRAHLNEAVLQFLQDWVTHHILESDKVAFS